MEDGDIVERSKDQVVLASDGFIRVAVQAMEVFRRSTDPTQVTRSRSDICVQDQIQGGSCCCGGRSTLRSSRLQPMGRVQGLRAYAVVNVNVVGRSDWLRGLPAQRGIGRQE